MSLKQAHGSPYIYPRPATFMLANLRVYLPSSAVWLVILAWSYNRFTFEVINMGEARDIALPFRLMRGRMTLIPLRSFPGCT